MVNKKSLDLKDFKYDLILSIGEDCACAQYLNLTGLRLASFPFDWITLCPFETRINLIINDFENFFNKEDFYKLEKNPDTYNDDKCDYYQNKRYLINYYHDFRTHTDFEKEFDVFKEKYERRIERFYTKVNNSKNVLFVWLSRDKILQDNVIIEAYKMLNDKFTNSNISLMIIENNYEYDLPEYFVVDEKLNILKVQCDIATFNKSKPEEEYLGNQSNLKTIFSNMKLKYYIIKKNIIKVSKIIAKLLTFWIPKKCLRRDMRSRLEKIFQNV